jgi:hypothetical protein
LLALVGLAPRSAARPPGPEPQIVNGLPTSDWPSVAHLWTPWRRCSATFIGCHTVLTAAHCVCDSGGAGPACPDGTFLPEPEEVSVFLQQAGFFSVEGIRVAPGYEFGVTSDVAVLDVVGAVRGVRPAPINTLLAPPFGTAGTIVGFGSTASGTSDSGIKRVGAVTTATCSPTGAPNSTHICWKLETPVGPPGDDSTTCFGDSGGPLFADVGAGMAVAGVHSGLVGDCKVNDVGFDADVYVDRTWIQSEHGADQAQTACGPGAQVGDLQVTTLSFDGSVSGQAFHSFSVPSGTQVLRVGLNGESGSPSNDFDLYVRFGSFPTTSSFDCASLLGGTFELCEFSNPAPGSWHVLVDVLAGGPGDYQVTATMLPEHPAPPPLVLGDVVVADFYVSEVTQIDRASGDRSIASAPLRGSGLVLDLAEDVMFDADDSILVTNVANPSLLRVDMATGDRSVISGCADEGCTSQVGTGPDFLGPRLIAREHDGRLVLSDRFGVTVSAVVRVEPSTGDRTLVSGCTDTSCSSQVGSGPAMDRVFGIEVEASGDILVADTLSLLRIDPGSGDRSVVSGCADPACTVEVGSGPSFGEPIGLALEEDGDILVTDSTEGSAFRAIFRVDDSTGARTIVSGCANAGCTALVGAGTNFGDGLWGIAFEEDGDLLVTDLAMDAVFHVDPTSGDRTVVSGCLDATCASVAGGGTHLSEPLASGVAVSPPEADPRVPNARALRTPEPGLPSHPP